MIKAFVILLLTASAALAVPTGTVTRTVMTDTNGVLVGLSTNLAARNGIATTGFVANAISSLVPSSATNGWEVGSHVGMLTCDTNGVLIGASTNLALANGLVLTNDTRIITLNAADTSGYNGGPLVIRGSLNNSSFSQGLQFENTSPDSWYAQTNWLGFESNRLIRMSSKDNGSEYWNWEYHKILDDQYFVAGTHYLSPSGSANGLSGCPGGALSTSGGTVGGTLSVSNLIQTSVSWDDSPMVFSWQQTGAVAPSRTAYHGCYVLGYSAGDELDFQSQMRHSIAPTNHPQYASLYCEPHAHVLPLGAIPPDANRKRLQVVYFGAAIAGQIYGPVSNVTEFVVTSNTHTYVDFEHLAFTNFYPGFSGKFWGTFKVLDAAASNYTGAVAVDGDFHYPVSRLGTMQEAGE